MRTSALPLAARVLMAAIFVMGGYSKLMAGPDGLTAMLAGRGLPLPELGYWIAVLVELGGGLLIAFGLLTRPAALVLAIWCIVTGVMFHYIPSDKNMMIHFWKNICMAGGFIQVVAFGAGVWSIDAMLSRRGRAVGHSVTA